MEDHPKRILPKENVKLRHDKHADIIRINVRTCFLNVGNFEWKTTLRESYKKKTLGYVTILTTLKHVFYPSMRRLKKGSQNLIFLGPVFQMPVSLTLG